MVGTGTNPDHHMARWALARSEIITWYDDGHQHRVRLLHGMIVSTDAGPDHHTV